MQDVDNIILAGLETSNLEPDDTTDPCVARQNAIPKTLPKRKDISDTPNNKKPSTC